MRSLLTFSAIWLIGLGAPAGTDDTGEVVLHAQEAPAEAAALPIIDQLDDGDVLRVHVDGGAAGLAGSVRQCAQLAARECFNPFPVQFDEDGVARFQYQVEARDQCGPTGSCVVAVSDDEGERIAVTATVFGGAAPSPPTVTVTPDGPHRTGDEVRVDVRAVAPGTTVEVTYCGPDCGAVVSSLAGPSGATSTNVTIGTNCRDCQISVSAGVHRFAVPIEFGATRYDGRRLAAGLLIAAILLAVAGRLIAAIDWRPPSEADAPELETVESSS